MTQYVILEVPPDLGKKSTTYGEVFAHMESEFLIAAAIKTMVNYLVSIPPSYIPTIYRNFEDLDHVSYEEELYDCVTMLLAETQMARCEDEMDRADYTTYVRSSTWPYYIKLCNHLFYSIAAMRHWNVLLQPQGKLDAFVGWITDTEFMLLLADERFDCQQNLTNSSVRSIYFHPIGVW